MCWRGCPQDRQDGTDAQILEQEDSHVSASSHLVDVGVTVKMGKWGWRRFERTAQACWAPSSSVGIWDRGSQEPSDQLLVGRGLGSGSQVPAGLMSTSFACLPPQ